MAATASPGHGQGTVDRLATYFLRKFHETKSDNELSELQCTTQVKFEEIEKALQKHAQGFDALREEMRSFQDKAPSFFLHKFSAQLSSLGASRSDTTELALDRFSQRLDDEVKNLADQLADVSTKLAITTANQTATIDDVHQKIKSGDDAASEKMRQCESDLQSRLVKLEGLVDSSRTEEANERRKLREQLQDINKKLQSKIDGLERTTTRQVEQLAAQDKKIHTLEAEVRSLTQLKISRQNETEVIKKLLLEYKEELTKARLPKEESFPTTHAANGKAPKNQIALPTPATIRTDTVQNHTLPAVARTPKVSPDGSSAFSSVQNRKRPLESLQETSSTSTIRTQNNLAEPSGPSEPSKPSGLSELSETKKRRRIYTQQKLGPLPVEKTAQPDSSDASPPPRKSNPLGKALPRNQVYVQEEPEVEHSLPARTRKPPAQKQGRDQEEEKGKPQRIERVPVDTNEAGKSKDLPSSTRREATKAFVTHAKCFAKEYNFSKPRSERQFIWSFLDGIPDPAWARYMQEELLEAYPQWVQPSLGIRAKHIINFGEGLLWKNVVTVIRTMQQKRVPDYMAA